jgi:hypothetical protein
MIELAGQQGGVLHTRVGISTRSDVVGKGSATPAKKYRARPGISNCAASRIEGGTLIGSAR